MGFFDCDPRRPEGGAAFDFHADFEGADVVAEEAAGFLEADLRTAAACSASMLDGMQISGGEASRVLRMWSQTLGNSSVTKLLMDANPLWHNSRREPLVGAT